ncbi:TPA: aldehyde dehydrogenase family protein [Burkholderia multivorans]|nr:aldehyde dehydrogenase family protein [Burkholderia multivorans]
MQIGRNYVGGEWCEAVPVDNMQTVVNPATGEVAAAFVEATVHDVDRAMYSARRAFDTTAWAQSPKLRSDVLRVFADNLEAQKETISQWLVTLNGKLKREADSEIHASISELRYYAGLARNLFGRVIEIEPDRYSHIEREPIGVAAIIVPWNAPVALLIRSLAPALAAGCTAVIKSAHQTSPVHDLTMACLVSIDALPKGVVNWVTGMNAEVPEYLCNHPETDVISFTGSTHVGKMIAQSTSRRLTRLSLELGGKAPSIVMDDADLDRAIAGIVGSATVMAGQMCTAISRVLVHRSIEDEARTRLTAALSAVIAGPGVDASSTMGPVIDKRNQVRLLREVAEAGATCEVVLEGRVPEHHPDGSSFITPSILAVQDLNSRYIQEELFGPIVTFETFSDVDEALHRANATRYGLASSIWTANATVARHVARRLKFGNVWVNAHNRLFAEVETGGYRESGRGRLHGVDALDDFMETKHLYMDAVL